jgi:hypothetical protein
MPSTTRQIRCPTCLSAGWIPEDAAPGSEANTERLRQAFQMLTALDDAAGEVVSAFIAPHEPWEDYLRRLCDAVAQLGAHRIANGGLRSGLSDREGTMGA